MADALRGPAALAGSAVNDDVAATSEPSPMEVADVESARMQLRRRWELASVLNFLHVFEPIIENVPKLSAEDVETAIIEQNSTLAELHIALLKGIVSASQAQNLNLSPDRWVVALSKTLSLWWRWVGQTRYCYKYFLAKRCYCIVLSFQVAEGDFPLDGAKGKEISVYKELEPISRVVILKALCEVRADQYDAVSYVNDQMKSGTEVSYFRKGKLASDGNRVAFWYDGSDTYHRLYKEVHFFEKQRAKHKSTVPAINCRWETLATNLEEFDNIVNEFSSSESKWEVALSESVKTDVIPVLEKQWRKKQRERYRQQREQLLWNGFRSSVATRSCRNGKHVDYKFDSFDKAISDAIKYANKRKTSEELVNEGNPRQKKMTPTYDRSNNSDATSNDSESTDAEESDDVDDKPRQKKMTPTDDGSNDSDATSNDGESTDAEESDDADDNNTDEDYVEKKQDGGNQDRNKDQGKVHSLVQNKPLGLRSKGIRFSKRLAGVPGHTMAESVNLGLKNRLRQRPSINTAVDHTVVSDSEDESSSQDATEDS